MVATGVAKKKKEKGDKRKEEETIPEEDDQSDAPDLEPIEVHMIPENQIKSLTEEQLNEEFTKALNANNPKAHSNLVVYDFNGGQFQLTPSSDQVAVHFFMEETLVHIDGNKTGEDHVEPNESKPVIAPEQQADVPGSEDKSDEAPGIEVAPVVAAAQPDAPAPPDSPTTQRAKALKNQFNYSERASQTFNNPGRDRIIATEPPPTVTFSGLCAQYIIFDEYLAAFREGKQQKAQKDQANTRKQRNENDGEGDPTMDLIIAEPDEQEDRGSKIMKSSEMGRAIKLLERIVNLNAEDEIFNDFKYFEDETDKTRTDGSGVFLPLWRFAYTEAKRRTVTCIAWNSQYPDMFAVSYGSYDFMNQQGGGLICCFTLKNTTHPEYSFTTTSGVMCIDFHRQHPALLAVGLYDGTVAVYDIRSKDNQPIYQSVDPKVKHTDPVWEVHWQNATDDIGKEINFFSISSDGHVTDWLMSKNELINEDVMQLRLVSRTVNSGGDDTADVDDDNIIAGLAGGTCFDFNGVSEHLFVVGTDEGSIHTCSKAYNSQYLMTFAGHHMAVYGIKWNLFHRSVFISCSADWTVKVWDCNFREPLLSFDLGSAVGDVAWAPYSSTTFAAVTADGKVFLFDLSVKKNEPIGVQRVVKKGKLTHVVFNSFDPILLVGDDRGGVMSLKLSPNLRRISAKNIKEIKKDTEVAKLDAIMAVAAKKDSFN